MPWSSSNRRERLPKDWPERSRQILIRDRYRCQIGGRGCLVQATEVDHIERGDDHRPENLQAACSRCHGRKSALEGNARKAQLRALRRRPQERHPGMKRG